MQQGFVSEWGLFVIISQLSSFFNTVLRVAALEEVRLKLISSGFVRFVTTP